MTIAFVGAGPGAADLITLRGAQRLAAADIVIWAASLVPDALLDHCRPDVELHDSKTMTLDDVCTVYAANPHAAIVRLHSGDTAIYSAIAEQIDWCRRNDRDFEIVPGVTSMAAAAAAAGCELTVPGVAQTVVMTRLAKRTSASMPPSETLAGAAAAGGTLALFLSIGHVRALVTELVDGESKLPPDTPVVAAHRVSWPDERVLHTTLAALTTDVEAAGFDATTILLVGPALAAAAPPRPSHVYAASYTTRFRTGDDSELGALTSGLPDGVAPNSAAVDVVGMIGGDVFGKTARDAVAGADVLVGSPRHLAHVEERAGTRRVELTGPLPALLDAISELQREGRRVCVLASGDPGFFGIARSLASHLGPAEVRVHPAPSSVALAFATQGWSWDDAVVASAHGRAPEPAVAAVAAAAKAAVLTDPTTPPEAIGAALLERGCERDVVVVSRIGEDDESVCHTDLAGLAAGRFDAMSVVLLRAPMPATAAAPVEPTVRWGRSEDDFVHRNGMITKAEVRAVALGKLALTPTGVLWDVGAGSGSVGIEAAALAPHLRVFSIERNPDDAERIAANAATNRVRVEVVSGEAPAVLAALPDPDRVFIGGGGLDVLDECLRRLRPGGVVVATYVLLDRAVAAHGRLGNMIQIRIDRCVPLDGVGLRMEPLNPVFVCWGSA